MRLPPEAPDPDVPEVAGNGLLDRRAFLRAGLGYSALIGGAAAATGNRPTEPWMHTPGAAFSNYGSVSPHENLVRWIAANPQVPGNGVSWSPLHELEGTVTPSGLHFERHHNGVPQIDPAAHRLVIAGLVERPLSFDIPSLLRYPRRSLMLALECGGNSNAGWQREPVQAPAGLLHGLASCSEWTGVPLRLVLKEVGVRPSARWLVAEGADAFGMAISIPLEKALDDCLLGLFQNGERVRPEQGYPLRLVVPGFEGVTWVKWLRGLTLSDVPLMSRNETARYTELQPDGRARMFTFVMGVKSVITTPTVGVQLAGPGFYEISGLAWSGHGAIRQVEVTADGGKTWAAAHLDAPPLPRSFTRFRLPWRWDGEACQLASRASDDSGNLQPSRAELIASRGNESYFHYNAVVTWGVAPDGHIRHVYPEQVSTDNSPGDPMSQPWS